VSPLLSMADVFALVGLLFAVVLLQAVVVSVVEARQRQRRQRAYARRLVLRSRGRR